MESLIVWTKSELTQLFPQLESMEQEGITYLDSAATSLKLKSAVERQCQFDLHEVANVHRGAHRLSGAATTAFEESRKAAAKYLNCKPEQIVFTNGTTDSLNLIAQNYKNSLTSDDIVLLTEMEHHANLLPWQEVAKSTSGPNLKFVTVSENSELDLNEVEDFLKDPKTKVFSLCEVSNTLGTCNPIKKISDLCKKYDVDLVVDGAQAATINQPDLTDLDPDFYSISTHKIFGPFGVGILYVKDVNSLKPYKFGGGIVTDVSLQEHSLVDGPQKFETGTPNISGVVALQEVFKFLNSLDFKTIEEHEKSLLAHAESQLKKIQGYTPVGSSKTRVNILSFNFKGVHPNDLCELLDEQGVALRSGHHCTQPLLKKLGHKGCARASFSIYNTEEDVDKLIKAVHKSLELLGHNIG